MLDWQAVNERLDAAFGRLLRVYARYGGHNYYGWDDYADPRNFKGPTFWSEGDCVFRLASSSSGSSRNRSISSYL